MAYVWTNEYAYILSHEAVGLLVLQGVGLKHLTGDVKSILSRITETDQVCTGKCWSVHKRLAGNKAVPAFCHHLACVLFVSIIGAMQNY